MDLFEPTRTHDIDGKKYYLVVVEEYSRFTWVFFLTNKVETFSCFSKFTKKVQNEKCYAISRIKTNHGKEFENQDFANFCDENYFQHVFSSPYTPEQNGIAKRKNPFL